MPAGRNPEIPFPSAERSRIDVEQLGECRLGQSAFQPVGEQPLTDRTISGPRYVPQEPGDPRQQAERRLRTVEFSVRDAGVVGAELVGDLAPGQAQSSS
jgi:hypothetical protein